MRIAFLGLGHMGLPMARNLLGLEHTVTVFNRTPGKAKSLLGLGAIEAASVSEAVKNAEVAITMLADDAAVREVVHGQSGLLQSLPPKSIHLCMSTIGIEASAELASAHAQAGQGYVAAPVFGKAGAVASRHIWILAGGPEPQVKRCYPIFEALGHGYTRVGPHAALAHALKLGGNMLTMAMELAVSEILIYAKKSGLPPADYLRFLNTAVFRSHMVDGYGSMTSRPSFDPEDQTLDLAANELLPQASKDLGVDIPVTDLLNARLQAAIARGWGEQDLADLFQTCRKETGVEGPFIPGLTTQPPSPPPVRAPQPPPPELKKPAEKAAIPSTRPKQRSGSSPVIPGAPAPPAPVKATKGAGPAVPPQTLPANRFSAKEGEAAVALDLNRCSHFELIDGHVWAWSEGRRYRTSWVSFGEVELAFNHVMFLLIKKHVLLRPEAVLDIRPPTTTFGGGAKVRVGGNLELDISRSALSQLKDLLGT